MFDASRPRKLADEITSTSFQVNALSQKSQGLSKGSSVVDFTLSHGLEMVVWTS